jgi:poly(A) polymerase
LLFRYGTTNDGSLRKKAHIYTQDEHGIDPSLIDEDAGWVIRRLRQAGFHGYIVGGAVRDILVGRTPKDFDIATDAHPSQIRRLFRSARLIGRRFRLVHVYITREKYIEVSTFRSRSALGTMEHTEQPDINNLYGTMEEDAERRDFTINALYYCPVDRQVIDYVGGLPDVRHRKLRTLGPAEASFSEDPVRMIRVLKYASLLGFPLPASLASLIRRVRDSLLTCSRERMTEEVYKILTSGGSVAVFELFQKVRVFETLFPALAARLSAGRARLPETDVGRRLAELDQGAQAGTPLDRNDMFGFLFREIVLEKDDVVNGEDPGFLAQQLIRDISAPLFPSKKDLARAAEMLVGAAPARPRSRGPRGEHDRAAAAGPARSGTRRRRHRGGRGRRGGGAPRAAT